MDAMIGTLEFVARSDWVTVLPSLISVNDIGRGGLVVNPIAEPSLYAEFVVIEPSRRTLSTQARLFLERFEAEVAHIHGVWAAGARAETRESAVAPHASASSPALSGVTRTSAHLREAEKELDFPHCAGMSGGQFSANEIEATSCCRPDRR